MAVTFGFYDSINGDRRYNALEMSSIFDGIISDGVYSQIDDRFEVTAMGGNMYVLVGPGRAWFNHTWTLNDAKIPVLVPQSHMTLPRIDAVILDVNYKERTNNIYTLQGTPAANPAQPDVVRDDQNQHWQYVLAYINVPANATSITANNITFVVGKEDQYKWAAPYAIKISGDESLGNVRFLPETPGESEINSSFNLHTNITLQDVCSRVYKFIYRIVNGALGKIVNRSKLKPNMVMITDANGQLIESGVTVEQLNQLTSLTKTISDLKAEVKKYTDEQAKSIRDSLTHYGTVTDKRFSSIDNLIADENNKISILQNNIEEFSVKIWRLNDAMRTTSDLMKQTLRTDDGGHITTSTTLASDTPFTFARPIKMNKSAAIAGGLTVSGTSKLNNDVRIGSQLFVNSKVSISGNLYLVEPEGWSVMENQAANSYRRGIYIFGGVSKGLPTRAFYYRMMPISEVQNGQRLGLATGWYSINTTPRDRWNTDNVTMSDTTTTHRMALVTATNKLVPLGQ